MLESIDIDKLTDLQKTGVVTRASVDRAKIINDFYMLRPKFRRIEMLYWKLSEKHNKSYYTIRNIIIYYDRHK